MKKVSTSFIAIAAVLFICETSTLNAAPLDGVPPLTLKSNILEARGGGHGGGRDFHGGDDFHGNQDFHGDNAIHGNDRNVQDHNAVTRHYNQDNFYGGGYVGGEGVIVNGNQNCYYNAQGQYICD